MPIVVEPKEYIGQLLYLKFGYGWGWHGADDGTLIDYAVINAAGNCHVHVHRFFSWHDEVRGVIGTIEESGHLFNGLWIVCAEMLKGDHDFTKRLCTRYDLELGTEEPNGEEWPRIVETRRYAGYGVLAESPRHIEDWYASFPRQPLKTPP